MKSGRPALRGKIMSNIIEILSEFRFPVNISFIQRKIKERTGSLPSWNTVKKYLEELAVLDKVEKIVTPHSKKENEKGIILYRLKKREY